MTMPRRRSPSAVVCLSHTSTTSMLLRRRSSSDDVSSTGATYGHTNTDLNLYIRTHVHVRRSTDMHNPIDMSYEIQVVAKTIAMQTNLLEVELGLIAAPTDARR